MNEETYRRITRERPWLVPVLASQRGRYRGLIWLPEVRVVVRTISADDFIKPVIRATQRNQGVKKILDFRTVWVCGVSMKRTGLHVRNVRASTRKSVQQVGIADLLAFSERYWMGYEEMAFSHEKFVKSPNSPSWNRQFHSITVLSPHKGIRILEFLSSIKR
ncbi:MAG: hypothetical protein WC289_02175 [Patescibacteria group bacterium]|jgi:hypothetical protein